MLNRSEGWGVNPRVYVDDQRSPLEFTDFHVVDRVLAMFGVAEHDPAIQISVRYRTHSETWQVDSLTVSSLNETITTESLRDIGVVALRNKALASARNLLIRTSAGEGVDTFIERERQISRPLRIAGPTAENLERVATLYRLARLAALPTSAVIQDAFDLPPRTAAHWLKLARQRGHLAEGLEEL